MHRRVNSRKRKRSKSLQGLGRAGLGALLSHWGEPGWEGEKKEAVEFPPIMEWCVPKSRESWLYNIFRSHSVL